MPMPVGVPEYLHDLVENARSGVKRGSMAAAMDPQFLDHCRPLALDRALGDGPPGPGVPIGRIAIVALLAMQIGMDPGPVAGRVRLGHLVGLFPVSVRVMPERQKGRACSGWRFGLGFCRGYPEFLGRHGGLLPVESAGAFGGKRNVHGRGPESKRKPCFRECWRSARARARSGSDRCRVRDQAGNAPNSPHPR